MNQNNYKSCHSKDPTHVQSETAKKGVSTVCTTVVHAAFLPKIIRDRVNKPIDSLMPTGYWRVIGFLCKLNLMLFLGAICGLVVGIGLGFGMGIILESTYGNIFDGEMPLRFNDLTVLTAVYYASKGTWIGAISVSILFGIGTAISEMRKKKVSRTF